MAAQLLELSLWSSHL